MNHAQKRRALDEKITHLQSRGLDLDMEFANGGWRLTNKDRTENISPRLSYSEMVLYLDGYSAAVARSYRHAMEMTSRFDKPDREHPSGLSGEHDVVLDAIHEESLHGR